MMFAPPNGHGAAYGTRAFVNARIVDPSRTRDETGGVLLRDGAIVACGADVTPANIASGTETTDCGGRTIIPGLVDLRVHTGEPGAENRETIGSASRAAVSGGVTTMVVMPDTAPIIDDVSLVEFILRTARETALARVLPSAALTKGFGGREMTEIGLLRQAGAVMLTDANHTVANAGVMRRIMTYACDFGMPVCHFTHDGDLASDGVMNEGLFASLLGLPGIPREAELVPLLRDLELARMTGVQFLAAKLSTQMSMEAMRRAKSKGVPARAAATIQHLTLNENDIGAYRTFFKLMPPLRHEDDRLAMVDALADGTLDILVSGHNPQDVDQKRLPFAEAATGAVALETFLAAGLRLFHSGQISLLRLVEAMSTAPARYLGIDAGTLAPGAPADLAIVDLDHPWVVDLDDLNSLSKNSAFEAARFSGKVMHTMVAGRTVFQA